MGHISSCIGRQVSVCLGQVPTDVCMAISSSLLVQDLRGFRSARRPRAALMKALDAWGARRLGRGHFATVYGVGPFALKVMSNRRNGCALRFARFCRRHHERVACLPKVFHVVEFSTFSVVVMERLAHRCYAQRLCPHVRREVRAVLSGQPRPLVQSSDLGVCPQEWKWLVKKIHGFTAHHPKSSWDLHCDNVMFRGRGAQRQWVLNDPITR